MTDGWMSLGKVQNLTDASTAKSKDEQCAEHADHAAIKPHRKFAESMSNMARQLRFQDPWFALG
uniref:Uncharacterized protein n=1 Tax=Melanopsichium pennsylvanicum 4 TaxID=1398559 RepID=A0A077R9R8_9BASI|nr:uncharacterized protein BN887_06244 [Melanopsichium pennsylvanicum 4]